MREQEMFFIWEKSILGKKKKKGKCRNSEAGGCLLHSKEKGGQGGGSQVWEVKSRK